MGAHELLQRLESAGFDLVPVDGGGIRVRPIALLSAADRQAIKDQRVDLLAMLFSKAVEAQSSMNHPSLASHDVDADRCCWPHSDAMNTTELMTFTARLEWFSRRGLDEARADQLADMLTIRDRQRDEQRVCLECSQLGDAGRCLAAAAGRHPEPDRWLKPDPTVLRHCEMFAMKRGLP